jgi:catechol 2,3-dioxygenase-like lactoylglutathione lyase family enzyme
MIVPDRIGHVVIKVRDLERSRKFYTEVLGLKQMMDLPEFKMVFFASNGRDHHELEDVLDVAEAVFDGDSGHCRNSHFIYGPQRLTVGVGRRNPK